MCKLGVNTDVDAWDTPKFIVILLKKREREKILIPLSLLWLDIDIHWKLEFNVKGLILLIASQINSQMHLIEKIC